LKYASLDERALRLSWASKTVPGGIKVPAVFDTEDHNGVHFVCNEFCQIPEDKLGAAVMACNRLNKQYRWFKFYVDDDPDVMVENGALVDMDSVGRECLEIVVRMVDVVLDVYPELMKVIYA